MLPRTSKLTTKCVSIFQYFFWFLIKFLLKLGDRKISDCYYYSIGRHRKNISFFAICERFCPSFVLINSHHSLLIYLNRGSSSRKSNPCVLGTERNSQFSHLTKAVVETFCLYLQLYRDKRSRTGRLHFATQQDLQQYLVILGYLCAYK